MLKADKCKSLFFVLYCSLALALLGSSALLADWSYETGAQIDETYYTSPAVDSYGTIYVGSDSLYAINPDGTRKWATHPIGYRVNGSPVVGKDGMIYVTSTWGYVLKIDPETGDTLWKSEKSLSNINASPALGSDGTIYAASSYYKPAYPTGVYAINPEKGKTIWTLFLDSGIYSSPAVGSDGTVYVASKNGILYALDPVDGTIKDQTPDLGSYIYSSPAIGSDGTIYIGVDGTWNGQLCAIDPADLDNCVASPTLTGKIRYSSPAIGSDGTIYVGTNSGNLYALERTTTGITIKFSLTLGGSLYSSPAIGSDGTIYVGSTNGNLYAVDPSDPDNPTATVLLSAGDGINNSPTIDGNGILYVGSLDKKLYAKDTGTGAGLADSPWPKFRYDLQNTGSAMIPNETPVAEAGEDQEVFLGDEVSFDGSGSSDPDGYIVSYAWDLDGDPTNDPDAEGVTASHTYTETGTYTVTLTVTDDMGATATDQAVITVQNNPPVADAGEDQVVFKGDEVSFDGSGSSDPDGDDLSFAWDFNADVDSSDPPDGDPTNDEDATGVEASTSYAEAGTYTVTLTVTDNNGATGTDQAVITVKNRAPAAVIAVDNPKVFEGDEVSFDGSGSSDPDGDDLSFAWDFDGDGNKDAEGAEVGHTYLEAGTYAVTLTVTDVDEATGQASVDITVQTPEGAVDEIENIVDEDMVPDDFDNAAHQGVLLDQFSTLAADIEGLNPKAALARLYSLRKKVEKWVVGEEQAAVLALIDRLIAYFESPEATGGDSSPALSAVGLPAQFALFQNDPNPFNPSTTVSYAIPEGKSLFTSLEIYNTRGQLVKILVSGMKGPGRYVVNWNGRDDYGRAVSSGVYFYRIKAGDFVQTRKMLLLK